ncbi:MAG: hypothetical protein GY946_32550 [bacterium]|nr:hypothetical protein [bacterium]
MSREPDDAQLNREEEAFVRGVRTHYRAPESTPEEHARFRASLERRLERSAGWSWAPAWGLAAAAAAALLLFLLLPEVPIAPTATTTAAITPEQALLSLADEAVDSEQAFDDTLPDDYAAIAGLFLDG